MKIPFFSEISSIQTSNLRRKISRLTLIKIIIWSIWICLVIAIARPQTIGQKILIEQDNRVVILVLDASGSMIEADFEIEGKVVSRFYAMKKIVADFIKKREGDKIGIILFGSGAYTYAPPSDDTKTLLYLLDTAEQGIVGGNTAIGDGLGLAVKMADAIPQDEKIVILLSDGISNAGKLRDEDALELAKESGVKIYTIGMGTSKKTTFFGIELATEIPIDDVLLQNMADETGGKFYLAQNSKQLSKIYDEINALEPFTDEGKYFRPVKEWFYVPLSCAFFLSLWLFIFIAREDKNAV